MTEEWRAVLDGLYEVSSMGRMRRAAPGRKTHAGRLLKPVLMKIGYLKVSPVVGGKNRQKLLHALVAEAFLGPCPEGCEVNHIDGDKANPAASNLEYVSHQGNMGHAARSGLLRVGADHHAAKLTEQDVRAIRAERAAGLSYGQLKGKWKLSTCTLFNIVNRKSWRHVQ